MTTINQKSTAGKQHDHNRHKATTKRNHDMATVITDISRSRVVIAVWAGSVLRRQLPVV